MSQNQDQSRSQMRFKNFVVAVAVLGAAMTGAQAAAAVNGPSGFSYEGRLYNSAGLPSQLNVQFVLEIYNPTATCLLRREQTSSLDLSQSDGYFSVTVGQGTTLPGDPGLAMTTVFANSGAISGSSCSYTPVAGDGRVLKVSVYDGSTTTAMTPNIAIGASPYAMVADTVQGKSATDLLQVNATTAQLTQANLESVFGTAAQVATLQTLASGGGGFMTSSASDGTVVPNLSSAPGTLTKGQFWYNTTTNTLNFYNGSTTQALSAGGGAVTSVTGTMPIVVSGTVAAPVVGISMATTSQNGYLTSADWNTFNGKFGTGSTVPVANGGTGTVNGSITGTGALMFSAGGANQNVGLLPSGTGSTLLGGNVGIGTSSPASQLHISAPSSTAALMIESGNASSTSQLSLKNSSAKQFNLLAGGTSSTYADAFVIYDFTSALPRLMISSAGNIGVGTTSSAAINSKLHLSATDGNAYVATSGSNNLPLGSNNYLRVTNAANLDATGPVLVMEAKNSASTVNAAYIGTVSTASSYSPSVVIGTQSGANSYAERIRIDPSGNVGIGTTSPGVKLEVSGQVKFGTTGGAISGMGTCIITSQSWTTAPNTGKTCTGVPATNAMVFCAPATAVTGQTFAVIPTAASTVTVVASVAGTTALNCYWVLP